MSLGTRAIADAGAALRTLLEDALRVADPTLGTVRVGSLLSDRSQDAPSESRSRLDLVLLRATESAPSRQHLPSEPAAPRPLAVDLHFLLAVHADDGARAERLLGVAMQALHASPALAAAEDGPPIRVTLQTLPLPDLAALWTSLGTRHRLSVCYTVGPVLLGGDAASHGGPPAQSV